MAASAKCLYEVLGVEKNATIEEIKKAYKKLALRIHPDKNHDRIKEATEAFQVLQRAHETLTDPDQRAKYDRQRAATLKPQETKPNPSSPPPTASEENLDHSGFHFYEFPSATKAPGFPTWAITAINDLNLWSNGATIRARVTNKTEIKSWSNTRGEGKFFSMDLLDGSGEIRMTGFNTSVHLFYDMLKVNRVYYISWFNVKLANKQYTSIHDYELSFSSVTEVIPCEQDAFDIPQPQVTYNFVLIADIEHVDVGNIIDVLGVCKSVADCQNGTSRSTGRDFKKRELVLVDHTGKEIVLTLWGKTAEDFTGHKQPIIAVKGVQVSDFGGNKSLSCLTSSLIQVNPDLAQAHALRRWYESEGSSSTTQSLSGDRAQDTKPYSNGAPQTTSKENVNRSSNGRRFNSCDFPSAPKKPNVSTWAITAIKDLNLCHDRVAIRARVTWKYDVKSWYNANGEGKLFSMDLLDGSGEIRMTGFNTFVDLFHDMIKVDRIYDISCFSVKPANKQYTSIKHDYELSFNNNTEVIPCEDATFDVPRVTYNFVFIVDIENVGVGKTIDVLGVCKSVADCQNLTSWKTGKELKKRELVLIDHTCKEIVLTLWGKTAEDFSGHKQPIIAVKGVQVSDFAGKSLSCLTSSLFKVNPDLAHACALRKWYDSVGFSLTTQKLSSARGKGTPAPWKLAVEANEATSSDKEKGDIFMCKVTLVAIKGHNAVYKACTAEKCNKKVVDLGNGMYRCEKCAADIPTFRANLMLHCQFADFTDQFWATCFHEAGEVILNDKGDILGQLYFDRRNEFNVLINKALFQQYIGKFRSKRKQVDVLELTRINHGEYAKQLLNEIRECSS